MLRRKRLNLRAVVGPAGHQPGRRARPPVAPGAQRGARGAPAPRARAGAAKRGSLRGGRAGARGLRCRQRRLRRFPRCRVAHSELGFVRVRTCAAWQVVLRVSHITVVLADDTGLVTIPVFRNHINSVRVRTIKERQEVRRAPGNGRAVAGELICRAVMRTPPTCGAQLTVDGRATFECLFYNRRLAQWDCALQPWTLSSHVRGCSSRVARRQHCAATALMLLATDHEAPWQRPGAVEPLHTVGQGDGGGALRRDGHVRPALYAQHDQPALAQDRSGTVSSAGVAARQPGRAVTSLRARVALVWWWRCRQ